MEVDPQIHVSSGPTDGSEAAVRDAEAIALRIAADEAAADAERARLDGEPLRPVEPGPEIVPYLAASEVVLTSASATLLADSPRGEGIVPAGRGRLLLTSLRLVHASESGVRSFSLGDVAEVGVVGDRQMLVAADDGRELRLDVAEPRVFRVRIAYAVAADRRMRER